MAQASTTFDYHYEGKVALNEVPSGVDAKVFDYHYEGVPPVAETESAGAVAPTSHLYGSLVGPLGGAI